MTRSSRIQRPSRASALVILLLAVVTAVSCTIDDPVVTSIGAVTIFPVNPSIVSQSVQVAPAADLPGNRMQATIWTLVDATLTVDGVTHDLLFDDGDPLTPGDCRAIDTPTRATLAFGECVDFVILEALDEDAGSMATLDITFWVQFKRVIPFVLPLIGDEDSDGLLNGNDNCPLIPNPDQADTGGFGIGDACRVVDFFSGVQLDSDADGVADRDDNCAHIANPLQVNPPSADFPDIEAVISDGIGLACEGVEEVIDIGRAAPITQSIDIPLILAESQGFVVIDFGDGVVAPNCEWAMGTCTGFDPNAITACISNNAFEAQNGCD